MDETIEVRRPVREVAAFISEFSRIGEWDTAVAGGSLRPHAQRAPQLATCEAAPALFPLVDRRCDSFSQWWARTSRGLHSAADLLAVSEGTAS